MKKRNKVMIIIASILTVTILLFVGFDGTFLNKKYTAVWSAKYIESLDNDPSKLIAYGIRAASSHNSQPWRVKIISADTVELYADMDKALHVVDGDFKQLLMSQGTFIESYKLGASLNGYEINVTYNEIDFQEKMPLIATIKMQKKSTLSVMDTTSGSTYDAVDSNKDGDLKRILDESISEYPGFKYTIVESDSDLEKLKGKLLEGTMIESRDQEATQELLDVFRWTEYEKNEYRYGLSLNTLPNLVKPFVQPLMMMLSKDVKSFGESGINQLKDRLEKQSKYILIQHDNPGKLDYVVSGQIYQTLVHRVGNYDLRPAMQVLESFDAMKGLNMQFQEEYGANGEVVWVIGLQEKSETSTSSHPRHRVEDIIIQ